MNSGLTIERKRIDCNALPKGWQREEVLRKSGLASGKVDVYYYSPTGKRIDSKPQLARFLGDAIDISRFDFQAGKTIQHLLPPPPVPQQPPLPPPTSSSSALTVRSSGATSATSENDNGGAPHSTNNNNTPIAPPPTSSGAVNALKRKYKSNGGGAANNNINYNSPPTTTTTPMGSNNQSATTTRHQLDYSRAMRPDVSLVPPIRQTASIFKQPVTVVRNHEHGKVKHDATKPGGQSAAAPKPHAHEKPKQLFWEKRLERSRACHAATGEQFDEIALPKGIRPIGPNVNEHTVLQSLATALHVLNAVSVTGQTSSKTEMTKNATAFINPEQPLMQSVLISEEDVRRQEERVNNARKKLQDALKV